MHHPIASTPSLKSLLVKTIILVFGYRAGNNALYNDSDRFATDNTYAGIESGLVKIIASDIPITFDINDIVYKTQVRFLQTAGDYTTVVTYIAVRCFSY